MVRAPAAGAPGRRRAAGKLLLAFEWQDYIDLGFTQSHVIKRVLLQIERRAFFRTHRDLPVTLVRRDRLRYHHRVERAAVLLQRRYRVVYEALQRKRAAERERLARAKAQAARERAEGGAWWSKKARGLPVPDHGKRHGNAAAATVHGWGAWVGPAFVAAPESTRPHQQRHAFCKKTQKVAEARGLHFRDDEGLRKQREAVLAKLLDFEAGVRGGGAAGTG